MTIRRGEAVEATGDPHAAGHAALEPYAGEAGPLATVALAGIISDATFGFPGAILEGDPSAAIAAASCYAKHDFETFRRLVPTAEAQRGASLLTHEVLRASRGEVIAVGRALQSKGRLLGEEVAALLVRDG